MRSIWFRTETEEELKTIQEQIKLTGLKVDVRGKEVEVSPRQFGNMVELLTLNDLKYEAEDKDAENRLKKEKVPKALEERTEVVFPEFKMQPYGPQKEFLIFGLEKERVLLADIMGPQPLWAKVHTPSGWVEMGDIKVGDYVTGQDGKPKKVLEVHEKGQDTVYEITFSDRTKAYSTDNHLWDVRSPSAKTDGRGFITKPLSMIRNDLRYKNGYRKHFVPIVEPIQYDGEREVEDAYMIGVYVGDGCLVVSTPNITTKDSEIVDRMSEVASRYGGELSSYKDPYLYAIRGSGRKNNWTRYLKEIGVYGLKSKEAFVPDEIKYGTANTRREFIRGLLDADGSTSKGRHKGVKHKSGSVDLTLSSERLLNDVVEIIRGLGGTATSYTKEVNGSTYYRAYLRPNFVPYKLSRKVDNFVVKDPTKSIDSVEEYSYEDTRCISVEDELYLTDGHTVTHNTGKTFQAMIMAEYLQAFYKFKHVLIINGVYNNQFNWEKEIETFTHSDSKILGQRLVTRGKNEGKKRVGGTVEKLEDLNSDLEEFYLITNIATLRDKKIVDKLKEMVYNNDIGFVVVDEIHYCASSKSSQGKGLNSVRPRFRLGMSGTPFNEPMDMYDIETWLGTTYKNFTDYREDYGTFMITDKSRALARRNRSMPFGEYVFSEPDKFKEDLKKFMIRRTSILEGLPTLRFQDLYVEMGQEQRELYEEVSSQKGITTELTSLMDLEEELNKSTYYEERKAMTNPHLYDVKEDIKLETVKELLREIISNGKTALVFGYFVETILNYERELSKEFPNLGNYVTDNTEDPFKVISDFQDGRGQFLVGGAKKIGTGFNITRADYVIYADRPATWNDYEQSFMRAWRNGRTEPVTVIKILCIDTWDDKMSWNILERKHQSDSVLGVNHEAENVVDGRYEREM